MRDPVGLGVIVRTWNPVIDGPIDALNDYQSYNGGTASLSDRLIGGLMGYSSLQNLMNATLPQMAAGWMPTSCGNDGVDHSYQSFFSNFLTAPIDENGDLDQYKFDVNNTIGTIDTIDFRLDCHSFSSPSKYDYSTMQCCCDTTSLCTVYFELKKNYNFGGANNLLLSWIPGRPFNIHNTWRRAINLRRSQCHAIAGPRDPSGPVNIDGSSGGPF
jgi:hypothetical protein